METLQVNIMSHSQQQELTVEWLEVEAPNGCFAIFPGHTDLVSLLKPHSHVTLKSTSGVTSTVQVSGSGFVSIFNGHDVQILIFNS